MKKLLFYPVANLKDAMKMRVIRNECRLFMTHDTNRITLAQQKKWYETEYLKLSKAGIMTCYLFSQNHSHNPIGYGVIRLKDNKYWLTGGLQKKYRGRGYGQALFKELIQITPSSEVWLDVLKTNLVGCYVYKKLGFIELSDNKNGTEEKIIIMKLIKPGNLYD